MDVRCPYCSKTVKLTDETVGEGVICPDCQSRLKLEAVLSIGETIDSARGRPLDIKLGAKIGHFRVQELLGRGGFGSVYSAFDTRLERTVAIKIPRLESGSVWHVESFIREAQAAAQLRHPNIVGVHEVGKDGNYVYIVSDFVDGQTLVEWRNEHSPDAKQSASMIATVARAIHAAHERTIVHRDLKPQNIMVDTAGQPQITDFGLAKRISPDAATISQEGKIVGTPAYMSPEQAKGNAETADRRTDVYSLGIVLYELLAQRRPYRGDTDSIIQEVIKGDAPPINKFTPSIPGDLEAICLKAIQVQPGDRFQTALEFAEELERFVDDRPTLTRPPSAIQQFQRRIRQNFVGLIGIGLVIGLIASLIYVSNRPQAVPVADDRVEVVFNVIPPRADVAIVKVDLELGRIDSEAIITPDQVDGVCRTRLEPGWYIIEAVIPGYGIQEVWRKVPASKAELGSWDFSCLRWKFESENSVRLSDVRIKESLLDKPFEIQTEFGPEAMAFVARTTFDSGSEGLTKMDGSPRRPMKQITIPSFYLGIHEVSFQNFHKIIDRRAYVMAKNYPNSEIPPNAPVTNVTFFDALEYCELLGLRLPTFDEFMLAATNAGKTRFPWGNDKRGLDGWQVRLVDQPEFDRNQAEVPICNLFSSVLEWTQEVDAVLSPSTGTAVESPIFDMNEDSRVVVGGPAECMRGNLPNEASYVGPGFFSNASVSEPGLSGVGFRCAKSLSPRFVVPKK